MTENWLGRGYDNVPGKPFGWTWHRERDAIHNHLMRGKRAQTYVGHTFGSFMLQQRINAIQARIHKYKPTFKERSAAFAAQQHALRGRSPITFTDEELRHLSDLFDGANDPLSASIAAKIAEYFK
jgi:hypothetical protein